MLLGQVIKQRRLQLNYTQTTLAKGICNQNVISKLEQQNHAPKMALLLPILNRLKLTLNDVYSEYANNADTEVHIALLELQQEKMLNPNKSIASRLALIQAPQINNSDGLIYYYDQGLEAFTSKDYDEVLFEMDRVLELTKNDSYNVYTILAYLAKANAYKKMDHVERQDYFVSLIQQATQENLNLAGATAIQTLFICKGLVRYYINQDKKKLAALYAKRGLGISKQKQVASYVEEFYWVLAQQSKNSADEVIEYKTMALAFAKHNENIELLKQFSREKD